MTDQLTPSRPIERELLTATHREGGVLNYASDLDALDDMASELDDWQDQDQEQFNSFEGLQVVPLGDDITTNIPEELHFKPGGETWELHFNPQYISNNSEDDAANVKVRSLHVPESDQKFSAILQGIQGSLEYIAFVESGMLPRPDNLIGFSNPTMVKFARRIGLHSAQTTVDAAAKDMDFDDKEYQGLLDTYVSMYFRFLNGDATPEQVQETITGFIQLAVAADQNDYEEEYEMAVEGLNNLLVGSPTDEYGVLVWGRYEDFREGVLRLKEKFGSVVLSMAEKELKSTSRAELLIQ